MCFTRSYTQRIEAPAGDVFPLLCPVREGEWLAGWADGCELIHSDSGLAERGCVFRTRHPGLPETIWTISGHDPARHTIEFVRVMAGYEATALRIEVAGNDDGSSSVDVEYTVVPTSEQGARSAAVRYAPEAFLDDMRWWEASMNHWLRTGDCLQH